ncbi:hypothetical protein RIF29_15440 [Crotalaria pallida]|uniref:CRC domain-containing protein n=1 Tax=Crotalaria pallida TaxID=3830 RepID=A0AAN9FEU9_CROPI
MDSPPLPPPTSLEDSSKKEENSFIFDELDFLIQRDGSPPSLFELLVDFVGDESSCLAEQDSRGFKKVVSDQEEVNQEKPPCSDEAAGNIIQQQCTKPSMLLGNSTPTITGDNDSYKRGCACKKIKCLKSLLWLLCADGFKCTEFCTCIRCSNIPEYQVAIDNTKQKQKAISRKPVASVSETQNGATNVRPLKNEA